MPVPGADGRPTQLIDVASIAMLEKALNAQGRRRVVSVDLAARTGATIGPELDALDRHRPATALAYAIVAASSVIDFEAAVIDGWMPAAVRAQAGRCGAARRSTEIDVEGLKIPPVREGTVGIHARALGGASLPLSERFLIGATASSKGR